MCIVRTFLYFLTLWVCTYAQYVYSPSYGYVSGYPYSVSNQQYNPQPSYPCRSSCGTPQYTSYCQHLPCYAQQPSYYPPYPYYTQQTTQNRRVINPYNYPNTRTSATQDPYANIPVEIIDDDSVPNQNSNVRQIDFTNVPVEIIDSNNVNSWRSIPRLPPKITKSSQANYYVNQTGLTSNSVVENKPISATFTRSFDPTKTATPIRLDFLNGAQVTDENNEENGDKIATDATTPATASTTEGEEVSPVKSWFK